MSFLLGPIVDATTNGFSPLELGGMGSFGFPVLSFPPPPLLYKEGVWGGSYVVPPVFGRNFYGSGLFGGAFSPWSMVHRPWSPQSPLDLWGDDFYQHDKNIAGATLL